MFNVGKVFIITAWLIFQEMIFIFKGQELGSLDVLLKLPVSTGNASSQDRKLFVKSSSQGRSRNNKILS